VAWPKPSCRFILAQWVGLGPCSAIPGLPPLVVRGASLGVALTNAGFEAEEGRLLP